MYCVVCVMCTAVYCVCVLFWVVCRVMWAVLYAGCCAVCVRVLYADAVCRAWCFTCA